MAHAQPKKVNYLNNKDILKQIHASKMSYCYVQDDMYMNPDIIIMDVKEINKTKFNDKVKFGKNVLIGQNVSIGPNVTIGKKCFIGHGVIFINDTFSNEKTC